MKKSLLFLLVLVLIFAVTGCTNNSVNYPESGVSRYAEIPDGPYAERSGDWHIYADANELVEAADIVLTGKVKSIDFQVLDTSNALPVSESTPDYAKALYTIYNIEVLTQYKGSVASSISVRIMGGMVNYKTDEQIRTMEEGLAFDRELGIPIWDNYSKAQCAIGESYLFVLSQFDTGHPVILNLEQAVYSLDEPTRKNTLGSHDTVYYSGSVDSLGNPMISALDIVTSFGDEKVKEFEQSWVKGLYENS